MFYGVIVGVPALRESFELMMLRALDFVLIGGVVMAWATALRFVWRGRFFERWLGMS